MSERLQLTRAFVAMAIVACVVQQRSPIATIPRYRGRLTAEDARFTSHMNYDPHDAPLAWLPSDEILIGHDEVYSSADVFSQTCEGSGFYQISVATGAARAVSVGRPACQVFFGEDGMAADPEGRWIVYSAHIPVNTSGLFKLELSNDRIDTLRTGCRVYLDQPAVSRDGRRIAARGLCRDRNTDDYRIYVAAADGSGLHAVSGSDRARDEMPDWSPDGRQIVFQRIRGSLSEAVAELTIQDLDAGAGRRLTRGYWPVWSPDGQWIAFLYSSGGRDDQTLRVIRTNGMDERVVFQSKERGTYSRGWGPMAEGLPSGPLVWSPDSRWIAFTRAFDVGSSVWRVDVNSNRVLQVTAPDR